MSVISFLFSFVYCFNLEVAIARAEEARQLALLSDSSGDSRMGRYSWDMDSVRRWKRKLDIQLREFKAVSCGCCCHNYFICCLQENDRVVALYEGKLRVLEAREHALLYQERDVSSKEDELSRREESLKVRERDYNQMCSDLEAECWEFRRQFRFDHKVFVVLLLCS